jgi:hypothetical protein
MTDSSGIDALLASHPKHEEPLIDEDGVEIDTVYIMDRIKDIGEKITTVSYFSISLQSSI